MGFSHSLAFQFRGISILRVHTAFLFRGRQILRVPVWLEVRTTLRGNTNLIDCGELEFTSAYCEFHSHSKNVND